MVNWPKKMTQNNSYQTNGRMYSQNIKIVFVMKYIRKRASFFTWEKSSIRSYQPKKDPPPQSWLLNYDFKSNRHHTAGLVSWKELFQGFGCFRNAFSDKAFFAFKTLQFRITGCPFHQYSHVPPKCCSNVPMFDQYYMFRSRTILELNKGPFFAMGF